ncbi:hypothetical protein FisN_35Lh030 [Fistulifera solaris]|uniref:Kinesin light chain n=1 Tax=Fistulifera solaris TaxID=1519565 RepID=A0A1Z5KPF5_FISSO|nr:hypothetical protein FisN_35Lh030 [Fistulifera solaris]|eukprot:GAX28176.1 hypothetical protein FisN_35Lh030 [Fistulifera solaris]
MVGRMQQNSSRRENSVAANFTPTSIREETEGRSCLVLRLPKKPSVSFSGSSQSTRLRKNTSARRSVSSSDQSDDSQSLLSDQAPLLAWQQTKWNHYPKYLHNQSPTSTMDLPNVSSESLQSQQQPTQNSVETLLMPPVPTNRSPKNQHRRLRPGIYDGESEPEGVRGKEAVVSTNATKPFRSPGAPLIRTSFEPSTRSSYVYGYPSIVRQRDDPSDGISTTSRSSIDRTRTKLKHARARESIQVSPEATYAVQAIGSRSPRVPTTQSKPARFSDVESTASDDDILHMITDLMPTPPPTNTPARHWHTPVNARFLPSKPAVISPESPGLSRAAQQAAAAAAAVGHVRDSAQRKVSTNFSEKKDSKDDLDTINALAMEQVKSGDYDQALVSFTQVLQIQQRAHGGVHPTVASAYHNLGTVHAKRAALLKEESRSQKHCRSQALECFQAAARVARDSLGKNHPNVAVSLVRIGFLLLQSRQYTNAVVTFQEALRIRIVCYGPKHGLVANLYNNLGVCHMHLHDFEKGKQQLEQALEIQRHIVQENTSWVHRLELAETLFNIGGLCLEWIRREGPHVGRAKEAVSIFQESLNIRSEILGPNDPTVVQIESLIDVARSVSTPNPSSATKGPNGHPDFFASEAQLSSSGYSKMDLITNTRNGRCLDSSTDELRRSERFGKVVRNGSYTSCNDEPKADNAVKYPKNQGRRQLQNFRSSAEDNNGTKYMAITEQSSREINKDARIRIEPFFVPETSPIKDRSHDNSIDAIGGPFSESEHLYTDKNYETAEQQRFGYDDEESFMLRDSDEKSRHGRIHYPNLLQKAGMTLEGLEFGTHRPAMLVTRPYRHGTPKHASSTRTKDIDRITSPNSLDNGIDVASTGNTDRDDVMKRARDLLTAHQLKESSQEQRKGNATNNPSSQHSFRGHTESDQESRDHRRQETLDDELMDDGVAPLGGYWPSSIEEPGEISLDSMLANPISNLAAIHADAVRLLKNNLALDSWNLFEVVLQCQRNKHGPLHPDVASALHNVGISQLRAGSHADALATFEEAARIRKGSLGSEHPLVAVSMVKVGICLLLMHRFDQALYAFREALDIRKRALGPLHPSTARVYNNIGCVHVEFNEYREARRAFEAALDVQRNASCHESDSSSLLFGMATTLCNLGYLYRYRDMHAKACLVLQEAVDLQERVLGKSNGTLLTTLDNLADSYANSGNAQKALRTYKILFDQLHSSELSSTSQSAQSKTVLLYKMSRVYHQQNDPQSQLDILKVAQQTLLSVDENRNADSLERKIQHDIQACRNLLTKNGNSRDD